MRSNANPTPPIQFPPRCIARLRSRRREEPCFPSLKKLLKYVSVVILLCVILNAIVMVSVAVYLSVRPEAIARAFNASMAFYSRESWHKVTIDQLQFTFQCCGHTKYDDWIAFDWQRVDYASREEMLAQPRISDEEFRPMAVPYSCCSVKAMTPCFHADLSMNVASINEAGCARVLSPIILRNAAVTYGVSTFLVFTQILLALLMIRVSKRPLPLECPSCCECAKNSPSARSLLGSNTSFTSSNGCAAGDFQDRGNRLSTIESQSGYEEGTSGSSASPPPSSRSKKNSSARTRCSGGCGAARIRPSLHTEHRVPKKRTACQKCTRPN
ncbi:RDS/peripherin-like protein xRDS36 [Athalia rosae]|uniref:RDS/peripherin-like protein xRDS36 n=1 Tax=Athalia rosae TaxID=37344 RepID=UPI0020345A80|nr:RDS/peripherin-like protein xRDS36 [Athalia rosae]XP_048509019.1 RDS/peripherin-like protein xRDS36 [Athalia rosae]